VRLNASASGAVEFDSSAAVEARVDTLASGGFVNVSQLDVAPGNLTLDPDGGDATTISGAFDQAQVRTDIGVNDSRADIRYAGTSGSGSLTFESSNATQDVFYALVDEQTGESLDVTTARAGGELAFDSVPMSTHTASVQSSGVLTIRDVADPHKPITGANLTARFFEPGNDVVAQRVDTDGDGNISLTGLPVDERFTVQVDHPDYHQRRIVLPDLSQQQNVFMLNTAADPQSLEKRLQVQDTTGQFDDAETELILRRAVNSSQFGAPLKASEREFKTAVGGVVGADSVVNTFVQEDTRYRVRLRSPAGDVASLGAFTPTAAGTTTFTVKPGSFNGTPIDAAEDVRYAINRTNRTGVAPAVNVQYNDTNERTDTLFVHIYERGNQSNELLTNTSFTGPLGEVTVSEPIPAAQRDTDWKVVIAAIRDGAENIRVAEPLTPRRDVLPGLPAWLASLISVSLIMLVAGLSSQLNGKVGGVAVAGVGGLLWFSGIAPPSLGPGVVALALVVAGLLFINDRDDGGL
jgi:hypothetical protein